jgi:hypothetical protein
MTINEHPSGRHRPRVYNLPPEQDVRFRLHVKAVDAVKKSRHAISGTLAIVGIVTLAIVATVVCVNAVLDRLNF